jgi:metallo-beta-lactamase class B
MKRPGAAALSCLFALAAIATAPSYASNPAWTQAQKPFQVYGNTYYVGTRGLSAILVTSPRGHILIDGTLPENAGQIEANVRALGFRLGDIRVILNSHAHGDHAGAIAKLAHDSGAKVRASVAGARALAAGGKDPDDPQYGSAPLFPAVNGGIQTVGDGEVVRVGELALTAHATPGHTPGGTSWTWRSCEKDACMDMAYVDSLTALGHDGFRFTDDASHPRRVEDFRKTFDTVAGLPCDILMVPHPDAIDFADRIAAHTAGGQPDPLLDKGSCRAYAAAARKKFEAILVKERS